MSPDAQMVRLRRDVADLRDALVGARAEAARQTDLAFHRESERAGLLRRLAQAKAEAARLVGTTSTVAEASRVSKKLEPESLQLRSGHDQIAAERDQLKSQRDQLQSERDRLEVERDKLAAERTQMELDRAERKKSIVKLTAKLSAATQEVEALNARIGALRNSVSWKLTLPIRKIAIIGRGGRAKKAS
jgi:chromosome segregation ATPase